MKKVKKVLSKGAMIISALPAIVLAADVPTAVSPVSGSEGLTAADIVTNLVNYILGFAAAIAVLFLVYGGVKYMSSQGNEDNIAGAKHTILYSVIGLLVIVLSFVIVTFVSSQLAPAVSQ